MTELTTRQRAILEFITRTHRERGYPPSVREIGEAVGLQSPSSVHAQLATLADRGYLRKDPTRPRAIVVQLDETGIPQQTSPVANVPLVGQIAAGAPILATEQIEETLSLPQDLVGTGTLFALKVKGDSMTGAGIFDGDCVVVRQQNDAVNGDIVAALLGDDGVVKTFRQTENHVWLMPENPNYDPILGDGCQIMGKVVATLHSRRSG